MEHTREPIIQELHFNFIIKGKLHIIHYDNILLKIKTEKCINCDSRGLEWISCPRLPLDQTHNI